MSRIRSKGTTLELKLFQLLDEAGIPYTPHPPLYGKPDCLIAPNILIFADGDFWHGWHFRKWRSNIPKEYWVDKIEGNIRRDITKRRKLRRQGYCVIRVWEHSVKNTPDKVVDRLKKKIENCHQ